MPSLADNLAVWGARWDWSRRGDEWSDAWGGVSYQWWTTLFTRLQGYLPARRVLEIAPGFGRWTHFLRDLADELVIVDIAEQAIEYCRQRFADDAHVSSHVGNGISLPMLAAGSIDFVFSFDSLVHAEGAVLAGYLSELARILTRDRVAFLHHSNMASYPPGSFDPAKIHWRATSVSAALIEELSTQVGLSCMSQELVAWGNDQLLNDCITVLTPNGSRWQRDNVVVENLTFTTHEIAMAERLSTQYPAFRSDIRPRLRDPRAGADQHAAALEHLDRGEAAQAYEMLLRRLSRDLDPEILNDCGVLALRCGEAQKARDLLRGALALHPGHAEARQNLRELDAYLNRRRPD